MHLLCWLTELRHTNRSAPAARRQRSAHLGVEALEERAVLSATGMIALNLSLYNLSGGTATFGPATAQVDLNNDGSLDRITADSEMDNVLVALGNGDGSFQSEQSFAVGDGPQAVAVADVNDDDRPDIATANLFSGDVSVLLRSEDGTFQTQSRFLVGLSPQRVALKDVNNDGRPDILTTDAEGSGPLAGANALLSVLLNNGDGSFASAVLSFPRLAPVDVPDFPDAGVELFQDKRVVFDANDVRFASLLSSAGVTLRTSTQQFAFAAAAQSLTNLHGGRLTLVLNTTTVPTPVVLSGSVAPVEVAVVSAVGPAVSSLVPTTATKIDTPTVRPASVEYLRSDDAAAARRPTSTPTPTELPTAFASVTRTLVSPETGERLIVVGEQLLRDIQAAGGTRLLPGRADDPPDRPRTSSTTANADAIDPPLEFGALRDFILGVERPAASPPESKSGAEPEKLESRATPAPQPERSDWRTAALSFLLSCVLLLPRFAANRKSQRPRHH